jgi:hypothetical protein
MRVGFIFILSTKGFSFSDPGKPIYSGVIFDSTMTSSSEWNQRYPVEDYRVIPILLRKSLGVGFEL